MNRLALAALALIFTSASAHTQNFTPDELARRTVERRAVEAVIWGMSAVNYDLMLQQMLTKTKGEVNQFIYWSRPVDWKNQTLTPNPDAIYFMTFFNTKDVGPIVIEVPPAEGGSLAANIDDVWQAALEDAGPEGADKGKGGKYLILPPDYTDKPPEGYIALPSQTYGGFALLRSNLPSRSDADIAKSVAYAKRLKIYPLARAANPPPTTFTDVMEILFDSTIPFDLRFFQSLDRIVQSELWIERDRAMIDQLRSIGIEKGKLFNPDAKTQEILNAAAREAHDLLEQRYETSIPSYFEGTHWRAPAQPEAVEGQSTRYAKRDAYATDARGLTYTYGFIGIKRLGTAQFYLMAIKDKDGKNLSGGSTYRLTVPAKPTGKESNWVPTRMDGEFEVLFRFYAPEKPLFDKTWKLPDIERVAAQ
jgi:hypothetical protein